MIYILASNRAFMDGLDYTQLHNMVELDSYQYPTTKYDEPYISDVSICNVFVCKIFKASGMFGDLSGKVKRVSCSLNDSCIFKLLYV